MRSPPNKRKLNTLLVAKLKPKAKSYLVWDELYGGLAILVQPSGYKSFKFVYQHKRCSRWYTIGRVEGVSLALARETAARLRVEIHQGKDPAKERRAASSSAGDTAGTFATIATRYVEEHAKKKNKSWKQASTLITRYVLPVWGEREASTITRADVRAMLAKIDAPILQNQILASASAIFTWAVKQDVLPHSPCKGIERNTTRERERVLSDAEVPLFWSAFANAGIPGLALQTLLLTGQRPGEVSHMRFEHIEGEWWTMPGAPEPATEWPGTKNTQTHRVFLPAKVREIIASIGDDSTGFVFGQVWPMATVMRDICKALNIPRATPHDLRRTHGTTITGLGFGKDAMNRIENHKEGGIASVYDRHQYADENKRIMEAVAARLVSLAEGTQISTNVVPMRS